MAECNEVEQTRAWSDPRAYLMMYVAPLGGLVWAGGSVVIGVGSVYVIGKEIADAKYGALEVAFHALIFLAVFLGSLYYTLGTYQVFILELRERFIARKVACENGVFQLLGYYYKKATFKADEVVSVEPVVVSERWFQKRLGTLLSRSTRFTIPHGKNVNLKITLRDRREFFFPGEMGRPGQWKDEDVKELRDFMEGIAARNTATATPSSRPTPKASKPS